MPYQWPKGTDFALWELDVLDRDCTVCGHRMYICDHRYRHFHTLEGPVELVCKLNQLPRSPMSRAHQDEEPRTGSHDRSTELGDRLGRLLLDWTSTVFAPHVDSAHSIRTAGRLRDQALGRCHRQVHSALPGDARARQQDAQALRRQYDSVAEIILSIDGLQPEKGHETLYVVREAPRSGYGSPRL